MHKFIFLILISFAMVYSSAQAQMPAEGAGEPAQWQLTLDVIKAKSKDLLAQNEVLKDTNQQLLAKVQKLQKSIEEVQRNNEAMRNLSEQRHGHTDQEVHLEELIKALKEKKARELTWQQQQDILKRQKSDLDRKIALQKIKLSDLELANEASKDKVKAATEAGTASPEADQQLMELRKDIEQEKSQEVSLESELEALKSGQNLKVADEQSLEEQNKQLESRLEAMQSQKRDQRKNPEIAAPDPSHQERFYQLKQRKAELETKITAYEALLDQMRKPSSLMLSWPVQKKGMIHEMVQRDARNNQLREKVNSLHEDVDILRDQVAQLERRINFSKAPGK